MLHNRIMNVEMKPATSAAGALLLSGPTGIGKTELAIELARRHRFELISADSMQVYRGLAIGTAQPTPEELGNVRLHGCGLIDPAEPFSAKKFLDWSTEVHEAIVERGNLPLYVGGTGMYLRTLRWGLFDHPEIDPRVREALWKQIEDEGVEALHERLQSVDPAIAQRISPRDAIRIVRALEVAESTGRPPSSLQTQWADPSPRFNHRLIVLSCPRPVLVDRIERRVDAMLEGGWVEEVRSLLDGGCSAELHCFKALGYREIASHLRGESTQDEMRDQIKAKTRQFSKRQMTWLRKEREAHWIEFDGIDAGEALARIDNFLASEGVIP